MVEGCLSAGLAFSFRTEITRPLSACSHRDCDRCTRRYSVSHSREQISSSPNADLETAQRPLTALATKQTALPVPQSEKTEARRSPASTPRHRLIVAAIAEVSRIFPGRKRKNTHALRALPQESNPRTNRTQFTRPNRRVNRPVQKNIRMCVERLDCCRRPISYNLSPKTGRASSAEGNR